MTPTIPGRLRNQCPTTLQQMAQWQRPPRIAAPREFFSERSTPEVWRHTEEVAQSWRKLGLTWEEISLPDSFATSHSSQRIVMNVEAAAFHEEFFRYRG